MLRAKDVGDGSLSRAAARNAPLAKRRTRVPVVLVVRGASRVGVKGRSHPSASFVPARRHATSTTGKEDTPNVVP